MHTRKCEPITMKILCRMSALCDKVVYQLPCFASSATALVFCRTLIRYNLAALAIVFIVRGILASTSSYCLVLECLISPVMLTVAVL